MNKLTLYLPGRGLFSMSVLLPNLPVTMLMKMTSTYIMKIDKSSVQQQSFAGRN